jgi:GT2 family glycosyltransferase
MQNINVCPVTVAIPTFKRQEKLLITLEKILQCNPNPNEIIIHIDNNDYNTEKIIKEIYPKIKIIKSQTRVGPGGGRNKIIHEAKNQIVASFDDDSYPIDTDYFSRLITLFEKLPNAAVIGASIYHIGEIIKPDRYIAEKTTDFVGCGCAYRKDVFKQTTGYVSLPLAYGMEEVDLALRLIDIKWEIVNSPWLRVFHNTQLKHHNSSEITAASIANQMLLTYLRYPVTFWSLGLLQCLNRIFWLIKHGRFGGIIKGIILIPRLLIQHSKSRKPVAFQSLNNYLKQRNQAVSININ